MINSKRLFTDSTRDNPNKDLSEQEADVSGYNLIELAEGTQMTSTQLVNKDDPNNIQQVDGNAGNEAASPEPSPSDALKKRPRYDKDVSEEEYYRHASTISGIKSGPGCDQQLPNDFLGDGPDQQHQIEEEREVTGVEPFLIDDLSHSSLRNLKAEENDQVEEPVVRNPQSLRNSPSPNGTEIAQDLPSCLQSPSMLPQENGEEVFEPSDVYDNSNPLSQMEICEEWLQNSLESPRSLQNLPPDAEHVVLDSAVQNRFEKLNSACGQVSLRTIQQKSQWQMYSMMQFKTDSQRMNYWRAFDRARLLDHLQSISEDFAFRRETYYLAQSYMDAYLDVVQLDPDTLLLLGKTCLFIAHKMEEVQPRTLERVCQPIRDVALVEAMERQILNALNFRLIKDTLYFWLDMGAKLWDVFVEQEAADTFGCKPFKPLDADQPPHRVTSEFKLGKSPNKYRRVIAVLDLMSLHVKMHDFARPKLALAVLALIHLNESGLVSFENNNIDHLRCELLSWAELIEESPDGPFKVFEHFLKHYCVEMLPENFQCSHWASLMCYELAFVSQFFLFPTRYQEHLGHLKLRIISCEKRGHYQVLEHVRDYQTYEDYSSLHQHLVVRTRAPQVMSVNEDNVLFIKSLLCSHFDQPLT